MGFTKGPWNIDLNLSDEKHFVIDIEKRDGVILLERHVAGKDQDDLPIAHLIAAAPEMYEVLSRLLLAQDLWCFADPKTECEENQARALFQIKRDIEKVLAKVQDNK